MIQHPPGQIRRVPSPDHPRQTQPHPSPGRCEAEFSKAAAVPGGCLQGGEAPHGELQNLPFDSPLLVADIRGIAANVKELHGNALICEGPGAGMDHASTASGDDRSRRHISTVQSSPAVEGRGQRGRPTLDRSGALGASSRDTGEHQEYQKGVCARSAPTQDSCELGPDES